jgi:RimJ/RimL family protein N-acetyltransferase
MRDLEVRRNVGLRADPTLARTRHWISRAARDPATRAYAVLKAGTHVGNVVLDRIDPYARSARLSIYIGEGSLRGRGLGTATLRAVLRTAFGSLGLRKVWLIVHVLNERAIRAYEHVGFVREGRLRSEFKLGRRLVDVYYMGLLRSDFARARGNE